MELALPTCGAWCQEKVRALCCVLSSPAEPGRPLTPAAQPLSGCVLNLRVPAASSLTSSWRAGQADRSVSAPV